VFHLPAVSGRSWAARKSVQPVLAALIIFGWLGACWYKAPPAGYLWTYDQPVYLTIAYDIEHFGRITNGTAWGTPSADPTRPPGMVRTPLYPIFLAATAELDPVFNRTLNCLVQNAAAPTCPQQAPLPRVLQFLMTVGFYLMLWRIAIRATGSLRIGWLSLGVGLIAAPILIRSVDSLMTETLSLFFITIAMLAAVEVFKGRRPLGWALLSGAMVGLAALTRPPFVYLLPAVAIVVFPLIVRSSQRWRGAATLAAFLFAGVGVMTPWIARNSVVLGHPAMTSDYAQLALTQRVAYDEMNWQQYALFNLCSLPDGAGMGSLLVKPHACAKFGYDGTPGGFYEIGSTTLLQSTAVAAGGTTNQVDYILYHYVIRHPVWHAIVSIPMAMRGLWIDHYWGLVLAILCIPLTLRALRNFDTATLAVTLPGWFLLAFYAALSPNETRYNLMLIIPFSLAGGVTLERLLPKVVKADIPRRIYSKFKTEAATHRAP
jgi:4-amino-4-deoxy-L-arabinose transferase-like glycosyltransferase